MIGPTAGLKRLLEILSKPGIPYMVVVNGESLDRDYMRRWAEHLGVSDLLDSLFAEA